MEYNKSDIIDHYRNNLLSNIKITKWYDKRFLKLTLDVFDKKIKTKKFIKILEKDYNSWNHSIKYIMKYLIK